MAGTEVIIAERIGMITPLDWSLIDKSALSDVQLQRPNVVGGDVAVHECLLQPEEVAG